MTALIHSMLSWLGLAALAYCMGTLVCRLWVLPPPDRPRSAHQENLIKRLWFFFGISITIALACSCADFVARAAEMSNAPVRTIFPLLPAVILKTHFGKVWLIRISGLVAVAVIAYAGKRYRDSRAALWFLVLVGGIIAMTHSATGHAADKGDFTPAEFMDWLHLLAALVWGGGLFVLSLILLPSVKNRDETPHALADSAARFSRIAGMAVTVIVITSLYQAWIYVGSIEALKETDYGLIVAAKIVLFLFLLMLAAVNRYVILPGLMGAADKRADNSGIIGRFIAAVVLPPSSGSLMGRSPGRFRKIVGVEAILILGVLLCAVLLRHGIPASHYLHREHGGGQGAHMHEVNTGPEIAVRIETDPAEIIAGTPVLIAVHLEDKKGRPVRGMLVHHERVLHAVIIGSDLRTFAHIHPEDLGPITGEILNKATFPLRFTFPKSGAYLLGIDFATQDGLYSKTAMLNVSGQPKMGAPSMYALRQKDFGAYHMTLDLPPTRIHAGEEAAFRFRIAKRGKPVTDLGPYLGAPMHLAVVRSDLTQFIHAHGYSPGDLHMRLGHREAAPSERYGPEIDADITFPTNGMYKIFCQVQHNGKVLLFDFMVKVEEKRRGE